VFNYRTWLSGEGKSAVVTPALSMVLALVTELFGSVAPYHAASHSCASFNHVLSPHVPSLPIGTGLAEIYCAVEVMQHAVEKAAIQFCNATHTCLRFRNGVPKTPT
jgi:hypothetical protein